MALSLHWQFHHSTTCNPLKLGRLWICYVSQYQFQRHPCNVSISEAPPHAIYNFRGAQAIISNFRGACTIYRFLRCKCNLSLSEAPMKLTPFKVPVLFPEVPIQDINSEASIQYINFSGVLSNRAVVCEIPSILEFDLLDRSVFILIR